MPNFTIETSTAMHEAVKQYCREHRCTLSDFMVGLLRQHGFDREDVLEEIAAGKTLDIEVRRRTSARQRKPIERVAEYLETNGCQHATRLGRMLHLSMAEVNRAVRDLAEKGCVHEKPFERPRRFIHWSKTCTCIVQLPVTEKKK